MGRITDSLEGKNTEERATLKGAEIAKLGHVPRTRVGDYDIEIVSMNHIKDGVEVFARAWDENGQIGFGKGGTVDIERFRLFNPPIMVPDGTKTEIKNALGESRLIDNFKEDALQALLLSLAHTVKVKKERFGPENIIPGSVGNTTSTFYPDATAVDGDIQNTQVPGVSWATLHDASAGTTVFNRPTSNHAWMIASHATSPNWRDIFRGIFQFDTSSIPDTDIISSATLSLFGFAKTDTGGFALASNIYASSPASLTALVLGDYDQVGTTAFSSDFPYASFSTSSYNDFSFNATGIAAISKSGSSKFSYRSVKDADNTPPTHPGSQQSNSVEIYYSGFSGTANDPKLVVEHAADTLGNFFLIL